MIRMGAMVKEDISSILSSVLRNPYHVDLTDMLTPAHITEAAFVRSALSYFTDPDEDYEEVEESKAVAERLNPDYVRGIMVGLIMTLDIENMYGEALGRHSHTEVLNTFNSANAYLLEMMNHQ
jgi:hypothetical protein